MTALIQSLPDWALISGAAVLVVGLIGAGPAAGYAIERKRTAPAREAYRAGAARWIETGEIDMSEIRDNGFRRTVATGWKLDEAPVVVIRPAEPTIMLGLDAGVPFDAEAPGVAVEVRADGLLSLMAETEEVPDWLRETEEGLEDDEEPETPAWARESTEAIRIEEVWEAEVIEAETEAEAAFRRDPLGSWVKPPTASEPQYLPTADEAFFSLVRLGRLTGEGANVDAHYTPLFTAHELEEVYA